MITYKEALKIAQLKRFNPEEEARRIVGYMDNLIKMECEKLIKDPDAKIPIGLTLATNKSQQELLLPVLNGMVSHAGWQIEIDGAIVYCFRKSEPDAPKYVSGNPYR